MDTLPPFSRLANDDKGHWGLVMYDKFTAYLRSPFNWFRMPSSFSKVPFIDKQWRTCLTDYAMLAALLLLPARSALAKRSSWIICYPRSTTKNLS